MTVPWATLGGARLRSARVHVPGVGVWYAEIELEGGDVPTGRQTLALGDLRLAGTVDTTRSGANASVASCVLVAGAGGWSRELAPRSYHSDAGLRISTIAGDAAREAGETLGAVRVPSDALGADYVRSRAPASVTIADVAAGVPWWVDFDGVTRIEARAEAAADPGTYEVIEVDVAERLVTLAVDDLTRVGIGSVLSERLDEPLTVRAFEVEIEAAGTVQVRAWCGTPAASGSRLARALRSFVDHASSHRLLGVWAYEVVRQNVDGRLEVQSVERSAGLPDLGPVRVWPGIAGASCTVGAGAQVLVEFIDGDRRRPFVRGFAPVGGSGHVPEEVVLDASGSSASVVLGAGATKTLAYATDVAQAFQAVQTTLNAFIPGSGGASFPTPFVAPSASALGTSKVVAQ